MVIFDYIFYRTYKAYVKAGDPARIMSTLYISYSLFFLFAIFPCILADLFRVSGSQASETLMNCIMWSYAFFCLVITCKRYNSNYIKHLLLKFKNSKYNRKIPTWVFFAILFIVTPSIILSGMASAAITKSCEGCLFYFLAGLF